jgi:hypothetical protein
MLDLKEKMGFIGILLASGIRAHLR